MCSGAIKRAYDKEETSDGRTEGRKEAGFYFNFNLGVRPSVARRPAGRQARKTDWPENGGGREERREKGAKQEERLFSS